MLPQTLHRLFGIESLNKVLIRTIRCNIPNTRHIKMESVQSLDSESKETESIFMGTSDRFGGIVVNSEREPCQANIFNTKLNKSLSNWIKSEKRGIWFKVNIIHSDWIPVLTKNDFKFHHAKSDFVMLVRWLPVNEPHNIPEFAHSLLGVGAIVVNNNNEILLVKEKYSITPTSNWKLPGGYVEPNENLIDAAIREVYEETNIQTEFISLVSTRQAHHGMWDCSDLYTVISLQPISENIIADKRELQDCSWISIDDILLSNDMHELNKFFINQWLELKKSGIRYECRHSVHPTLKKPYTVYYLNKPKKYETKL